MFPNPGSWAWHCRNIYIPAVDAFRRGAFEKVIPAFANIAAEAEALAEAEFERHGSMPVDPDDPIDMSDVAEWASDAGLSYYQTMSDVRQGIVNVLVIGLRHLFEQQQSYFLEREPLAEGVTPIRMNERLSLYGIDVSEFPCASKLEELRVAANALKHGSGPANADLVAIRPDLFVSPALVRLGTSDEHRLRSAQALARRVASPMSGEHIYVQEEDLSEWCDAVAAYWTTLDTTLTDTYGHRSLG